MKKIIYIVICFIYIGAVSAQERYFDERYIYTQAYVNPILINPGAAGYNGNQEILFNYNNRWSSFENSPKTLTVSYNGIAIQRLGIGALIMKDTYGPLEMTKGQGSLSYGFDTGKNKLRVGVSGEYVSHKLTSSNLLNVEADDLLILNRLDGTQFFDISIGVMGEYENKLIYGVVFPSMVSSRLNNEEVGTSKKDDFSYIINLGYLMEVATYNFTVVPSVYVKNLNGVPGHIDLNLLFKFMDDKLTGGLTYGIGAENRIGFLVGTSLNKLNFYYSYNVSNNSFQHYNNGSHELTLGFRLSDIVKEGKTAE